MSFWILMRGAKTHLLAAKSKELVTLERMEKIIAIKFVMHLLIPWPTFLPSSLSSIWAEICATPRINSMQPSLLVFPLCSHTLEVLNALAGNLQAGLWLFCYSLVWMWPSKVLSTCNPLWNQLELLELCSPKNQTAHNLVNEPWIKDAWNKWPLLNISSPKRFDLYKCSKWC